ncbi:hypothetical protein [uncultured Phocaeicola sp.]|nr:hypothetical protein [uncultured Phocaeicola sp.]
MLIKITFGKQLELAVPDFIILKILRITLLLLGYLQQLLYLFCG